MSDPIGNAIKRAESPKKSVPAVKFETRLSSGLPVMVVVPVTATSDDIVEMIGSLCRELPAALAKQRGPISRLYVPRKD